MTDLSLFSLTGKKALVTGGSGGLGRSCALALAKGGADVAIVDLNAQASNETVEKLRSMGSDAFFVTCDIADQSQVKAMISTVVDRFGCLDIAVNCAAIRSTRVPEGEEDKESWGKVIDVNLTGAWLCAQAQAQQMSSQSPSEGKIINVGSIAAVSAITSHAYGAAKAGVVHMTKGMATHWAQYNINVNCFCPGSTRTPMTADMPEDIHRGIRALTPLGHHLRPKDFEGAVLFLASAASNAITGQNIVIDGGLTLDTMYSLRTPRELPPRISPNQEEEDLSF